MARKRLLSIDGGGIHGIIPACVLVKLEETTGQLTRENFQFIAGTSTGAIITAAVALGIPATKILDIYLNRGREIFTHDLTERLRWSLHGYLYSIDKVHEVLTQEMGKDADRTINSLDLDVLITATRVPDGRHWFFVKDRPANSGRTGELLLVDCVTASTAAPTFFQPWTIPESPATMKPGWGPIGKLVDGGVGVTANPTYQACVEAFRYTSDEYDAANTSVVSLGTGRFDNRPMPDNILQWVEWFVAEMLHSTNEEQTDLVHRHYSEALLYRIETELDRDIGLDDVNSMAELREYGDKLANLVDWNKILNEEDYPPFTIHDDNTLWSQYKVRVT